MTRTYRLSLLHAKPALCIGLIFLSLLTLHQPVIVKAELNGIEACENRCYNQSECDAIGDGISCCRWDDDNRKCMSNIGLSVCPHANSTIFRNLQHSQSSIDCRMHTSISMGMSSTKTRSLSGNAEQEAEEPAPSFSSTKFNEKSCDQMKSGLDYQLCVGLSWTQIASKIIVGKITATLSILGSSYVIQDVLRSPEKRNESTYHRLMVGLSCSDIVFSFFGWFLGTWVLPKGSNLFAIGSEGSCIASGFFYSIANLSTPLYNCSLATFYFLQLKLNLAKRKIRKIEKWLHILPVSVGVIGAISAAALSSLGPHSNMCW